MKRSSSIASSHKFLRNPKRLAEIATRFALSSSRIEGVKPSAALRKKLKNGARSSR